MAKATPAKQSTPPDAPTDIELASTALRNITGCGSIELARKLAALDEPTIKQIATAEQSNKRNTVPNILAAHAAKSKAASKKANGK
ncbi:hypothetical protein [Allorhodopirellula heiligendammensis]|uniref:Uncharacterized protein n=1 Tax=Allorhodopirellula heiligendammensis TaxID=2714739 RepID=A0A5C6BWC4_9BACT|nr:hypothetical protein [Allorhodopirellula heiligendammensis]TWU15957.1 hypothetical protein Poly21_31610 [Allorhodopirellula heiligendammensis]